MSMTHAYSWFSVKLSVVEYSDYFSTIFFYKSSLKQMGQMKPKPLINFYLHGVSLYNLFKSFGVNFPIIIVLISWALIRELQQVVFIM